MVVVIAVVVVVVSAKSCVKLLFGLLNKVSVLKDLKDSLLRGSLYLKLYSGIVLNTKITC